MLAPLQHIALIMDGNGRWAKQKNLPRIEGHRQGAAALKDIINACIVRKIPYLTAYAFSAENWGRPPQEVRHLLQLFQHYLEKEEENLLKNNIKLRVIGDKSALPSKLRLRIDYLEKISQSHKNLHLQIAFNYGSRQEIVRAVKLLADDLQSGVAKTEDITEALFNTYLYTAAVPHPDLLIRTSGEKRLSNYLLWQIAYTELFFSDKYWPDFTAADLDEAIHLFKNRERRFGKVA